MSWGTYWLRRVIFIFRRIPWISNSSSFSLGYFRGSGRCLRGYIIPAETKSNGGVIWTGVRFSEDEVHWLGGHILHQVVLLQSPHWSLVCL